MRLRSILALSFGFVVFCLAAPVVMCVLAYLWPCDFLPDTGFNLVIGSMCSAFGLFMVIWANLELWRRGRGTAAVLGPVKLGEETCSLVTTGPYAMCRNPMHLGLIFYYLGISCALNALMSLAVPVLMLAFAYLTAVFLDEPRLKRDFADRYETWAQEVPRFWPKIKRR